MTTRREALGALTATGAGVWAGRVSAAGAQEVIVPFELTFDQAWTAVKFEGHGWYKLLIDTGARFFSLDDNLCQQAGLKRRSSDDIVGAVGHAYLNTYLAADVNIANVVHDQNVGVVALRGGMGAIQGLIPGALLGTVRFDFVEKRMHLSHGTLGDMAGYSVLPWIGAKKDREADPHPKIRAELDGRPVTLLVDTGVGAGAYFFASYVERAGLWDRYKNATDAPIEGVTGGSMGRYVTAETLDVGGVVFKAPHITLQDPREKNNEDLNADGLLGMEALRRLDLALEPEGSRVFIRPNALFNDVERRNRSGLEVGMVQGKPLAVRVDENGPAWRAGVRLDDQIVGYAGGDGSLQGLRWKLRGPAGDEIDLEISRDRKSQQVAFRLEDPK